jgi:protein-serine/threonine kinase
MAISAIQEQAASLWILSPAMPFGQSTERLQAVLATQGNLPVTQIFKRLERVGKGAYGSVHKGEHIATGTIVALKIVDLDQPDDDIDDIQREVALLSDLHGGERSNITSYYGCWLDGPRVWIAMDFAQGGSIRTLVRADTAEVACMLNSPHR